MHRPNAEFWRLWGCALALALIVGAFFFAQPAEARGAAWHRHHHHVGHRHRLAARHHPRGTAEIARGAGRGDAVAIAMRYLGHGNPTGSHRPWCGDFQNMVEHLAGRRGVSSGLASAWRFYGHASAPVRGAIAVMSGHVSRVVQRVGDRVVLISGNWSHRVSLHVARLRDVLAFRMP